MLDLGAGAGHLGKAVAGHFSHVAGVEADPSARPPIGAYDEWVAASVSGELSWSRRFDVVVCADVLEHVADPESVLARVREWIAPDGLLLVSLPNVANVAVRISLLAGRFEYADAGILDRTHLRFYTRRSARRLVEGGGFRIRRVRATPIPAELPLPVLGRAPLRAPSRALFSSAARLWPALFGYQFVIEAEPA
jgi:predicted TPR repeat methyltransferase